MNKKDLLHEAHERGFYSHAGKFFDNGSFDAASIDQQFVKYSGAVKKNRSVLRFLQYTGFAAVAAEMCHHYFHAVLEPTSIQNFYTAISSIVEGTAFFTILWLALLWFVFEMREVFIGEKAIARALKPIEDTSMCEVAANTLRDGGQLVAGWRDVAIAERGALRVYDVDVMRYLRLRNKDMEKLKAEQAKYREAYDVVLGRALQQG